MYNRKAEIGNSCPDMKSKKKKIILGVLMIVIGLPMALTLTVVAWVSISDKTNGTIVSSGQTRRYLLYVPKTYDPSKSTPLVISLHPAMSWPAAEMNMSRWNDLADERGFIVSTRLELAFHKFGERGRAAWNWTLSSFRI